MRPLQAIAMGVVVLLLEAPAGGFDLLADPLGWLLVLLGVRDLPRAMPLRGALRAVSVVAAVASVPLWLPVVVEALEDADESLAWAANLPRLGFFVVLGLGLAGAATAAGDRVAGTCWRVVAGGGLVVVLLPALVFGGGLNQLDDAAGAAVALVPTVVVVLGFWHSGRRWAGGEPAPSPDDVSSG
ncbi:hypothetical protein GCM10023340_00010 [Nocardioides marinquilinus]|uniref:Uncharacterized protein n=1 Tax=Nocardioides marinquilinus TaxID=1210400 RepID=A0ABP9P3G2_9ACTN